MDAQYNEDCFMVNIEDMDEYPIIEIIDSEDEMDAEDEKKLTSVNIEDMDEYPIFEIIDSEDELDAEDEKKLTSVNTVETVQIWRGWDKNPSMITVFKTAQPVKEERHQSSQSRLQDPQPSTSAAAANEDRFKIETMPVVFENDLDSNKTSVIREVETNVQISTIIRFVNVNGTYSVKTPMNEEDEPEKEEKNNDNDENGFEYETDDDTEMEEYTPSGTPDLPNEELEFVVGKMERKKPQTAVCPQCLEGTPNIVFRRCKHLSACDVCIEGLVITAGYCDPVCSVCKKSGDYKVCFLP